MNTTILSLAAALVMGGFGSALALEPVMAKINLLDAIKSGDVEYHVNPTMDVHDDPQDIWKLQPDGTLHISGRGYGYVATKKNYRDYHLVLEFKWGGKTWGRRENSARDNGVLLHAYGPHGAYGGTWMASIEAQIIEGGVGDILVLSPKLADGTQLTTSLTCEYTLDRDKEKIWKKGEPRQVVTAGRINWKHRDVDWVDKKDFHGREDVESPLGEWNRLEVIAKGDTLQYFVNGALVNEAFECKPNEGRVLLQTEGAEMIVRRYELWPLGEFKEKLNPIQANGGSNVPMREGQTAALSPAFDIKLETISSGFDKKTCWVHPRAGIIGGTPSVVLTMQKLTLTGSDVFGPLNEMRTDDLGKTWSKPVEHASTLGRRQEPDGVQVGVCDFWPKWHAKSGKLLGIGHSVRYKDEALVRAPARQTGFSSYDPQARTWSPWQALPMPDEARFFSAGAGSVQRFDLPNGDILLPIYYKAKDDKAYGVTVLRCAFDGVELKVRELGNELRLNVERGLYEPSVTRFQGRYYLTLRNDLAGYVCTSEDGLHFSEPIKWTWDDGAELGNYNTQQHWVAHSNALFLVYTRKGANNDHVFRHRAPLFIAQVDPERLRVIRGTERILVPERGARLGNFGVTEVSEHETWVTVAEWMQTWGPKYSDYTIPMKYGSNNAVFVARIQWKQPNTTWNQR